MRRLTAVRVAHVNLAFDPGIRPADIPRRFRTLSGLAAAQAARGVRVAVLQRLPESAEFVHGGVEYHCCPDGSPRPVARWWVWPRRLFARLGAWRPTVVHLHGLSFPTQACALRAVVGRRVPILVQDHAHKPGRPRLRRTVTRLLHTAVDGFFFTAAAGAARLRDEGTLGAQPIFEIPESSSDFVPVDRELARTCSGAEGSPLVLWVGRLEALKDPLTAVRGFAAFCRRHPAARLAMVYQRDLLRPALEEAAGAAHVAHAIRWVGPVAHDRLPDWFASADLFLTASPWEGSNYALIESLACGTWPVASDNPTHRVLTGQWQVGHAFAVGDANSCAHALCDATSHGAGEPAARAMVRAHFERTLDWPVIAKLTLEAYEAAASTRKPPGRQSRATS